MPKTEQDLKLHLKTGMPARVYLLYGEESYLTEYYADQVLRMAGVRSGDSLAEFNLHCFDGQECSFDAVEEAVEALPLMAERKCVMVSNWDVTPAAVFDRAMALVADPPESTVLVIKMTTLLADGKLNAKWRQFTEAVSKVGVCVNFPRRSTEELVRTLCAGANRRHCQLAPEVARELIEQSGNDMNLLLNELDKLCAVAGSGEITSAIVGEVATKNLNAQVFELSNAIVKHNYEAAYTILHRLFATRLEPLMILAALSGAYTDLYRAKLAALSGQRAETLVEEFDYKGKAFRLRYAARDCSRLSLDSLRESLDILAQADRRLKSYTSDKRTVLEETAAKLIVTAKLGRSE